MKPLSRVGVENIKQCRVGEIEFLSFNQDDIVNIIKTNSNINNLNTINLL